MFIFCRVSIFRVSNLSWIENAFKIYFPKKKGKIIEKFYVSNSNSRLLKTLHLLCSRTWTFRFDINITERDNITQNARSQDKSWWNRQRDRETPEQLLTNSHQKSMGERRLKSASAIFSGYNSDCPC